MHTHTHTHDRIQNNRNNKILYLFQTTKASTHNKIQNIKNKGRRDILFNKKKK